MTEPRLCAYGPCGQAMKPRLCEKPSHFARRLFCSPACAQMARRSQIDLPAEKTCDECGETFRRGKGSPSRWLTQRFCSRVCSSRSTIRIAGAVRPLFPATNRVYERADLPERTCLADGCHNVLVRREGEKSNRFRDRTCCSLSCANRVRGAKLRSGRPQKPCRRGGCDNPTHSKYCSTTCAQLARRNASGDARRAGTERAKARKAAKTQPAVVVSDPAMAVPVPRPRPEDLAPDPAVVAMDDKRRAALEMLDYDVDHKIVAAELGVSVALINRWDRGAV